MLYPNSHRWIFQKNQVWDLTIAKRYVFQHNQQINSRNSGYLGAIATKRPSKLLSERNPNVPFKLLYFLPNQLACWLARSLVSFLFSFLSSFLSYFSLSSFLPCSLASFRPSKRSFQSSFLPSKFSKFCSPNCLPHIRIGCTSGNNDAQTSLPFNAVTTCMISYNKQHLTSQFPILCNLFLSSWLWLLQYSYHQ